MTIFVAHEPRSSGIDLRPLYEYAATEGHDIRFVFSASYQVGVHPMESIAVGETFAAGFNFNRDLLLVVSGDPIAGIICAIALAHVAASERVTSFKSLRFVRDRDATGERTLARYVPIRVPTGVH